MMRLVLVLPLAALLVAAGSSAGRFQHDFRPAETIAYRSAIEMTEGSSRVRQDIVVRLTVKSVSTARIDFNTEETSRGKTSTTQMAFEPDTGIVRNFKGENLALLSPLLIAYSPTLWGELPSSLTHGSTWSAESPTWSYGPSGQESVTLGVYDEKARAMSLTVVGSGSGPSRPELDNPDVLAIGMRNDSMSVHARMVPKKTQWRESIQLADGLVVRARIDVDRDYLVPQSSIAPEYHLMRHIVVTTERT